MHVGILVPHSNTVLESDLHCLLPPSVKTHTQRWKITPRHSSTEGDELARVASLNEHLGEAVDLLPADHLQLLVYGCTTGSFMGGLAGLERLESSISESTGLPVISVSQAIVDVLKFRSLRRIAVFTPYDHRVNVMMEDFLTQNGLEVAQVAQDPWFASGARRHAGSEPQHEILRFVARELQNDVDAVVLSCSAWAVLPVREELQRTLGVPVISANQAIASAILARL
jgi:maleate isomerase